MKLVKVTGLASILAIALAAPHSYAMGKGGNSNANHNSNTNNNHITINIQHGNQGGGKAANGNAKGNGKAKPAKQAKKRKPVENARVNRRQNKQARRIENGWRNGQLTRFEYDTLQRQQRRIERKERRFKRDGHLDQREVNRLLNMQDRASDAIREAKHNNDYPRRWHRNDHGFGHGGPGRRH